MGTALDDFAASITFSIGASDRPERVLFAIVAFDFGNALNVLQYLFREFAVDSVFDGHERLGFLLQKPLTAKKIKTPQTATPGIFMTSKLSAVENGKVRCFILPLKNGVLCSTQKIIGGI